MRIDGLPQQPKVSQTQQRGTSPRARESAEESRDVVEISQLSLSELGALAKAAPAPHAARLQEIRGRVRSGYYDSAEARKRVASALLASPALSGVVQDVAQVQAARQELRQVPEVREGSVEQARGRLATGFYDTPQVRRQTAERILDELA
ncbi:MAG: hypothetical protein AB1505_01060 [Candidatus Latescibacterota bacterium]